MKKNVKSMNFSSLLCIAIITGLLLVGCGNKSGEITVATREPGSGTRGAFIELFSIEKKDADGNKVDHTTEEANVNQSTSIMMTMVSGEENAIGYISLGSYNDTVKAVKINGVEASVANVKAGSYEVARPFLIATKENVSDVTKDFINFILSVDGQNIVKDNGYITNDDQQAFTTSGAEGKIVIAGSSSVTPVMDKLQEAYKKINKNADIELLQSDSTTGITAAIEGTCDIGMASRELKDTETSGGIHGTVIATDGIVVIVNNNNSIDNLTKDQVKSIYTGEVKEWSELTE